MSSDKEKPERPKSKMGGFSSVFRTLGRGSGKKEKTPSTSTPAGPIHGAVLGKPISAFSDVPPLARRCLDFLETDAVFRLDSFSLATASVTEVQRVIKLFEDTDPETVNLTNESPDTICGVLRKWLRSLPEPLFSYEQYDAWIAIQQNAATIDDLPGEIQNIMFQLHPTHYLVLQRILRFLHKLSLYGSVNRLSSTVIAYNWQSCLIWSQASVAGYDAAKMGQDATLTGAIVTTMIENYATLFLEDSAWVAPDDVQAAPAPQGVVVSAVPHHQLVSNGGGSSSASIGISSSNASISRSEDEEHSTESPGGVGSTPPTAVLHAGVHSFGSTTPTGGLPSSLSSSLPGSLSQSSSPLHIQQHQHHHLHQQHLGSANASPAATPPSSSQFLPPLVIPNTTTGTMANGSTSMPVTPITPLVAPGQAQPLARSFAGQPPSSLPSSNSFRHSQGVPPTPAETLTSPASPRHSMGAATTTPPGSVPLGRKKQPVLVNGYTQATTLCDFSDMTDGMLQFFKNEHIYITNKHEDGWWEGWKRGRRGFFPANYVVEIAI